jgi:hypothetical protein
LPGSNFDDGSSVTALGGWQSYTSGFEWEVVTCFTTGVNILTPEGMRKIETLRVGDQVVTKNNGTQEIAWIGSTKTDFSKPSQLDAARLRPIRIVQGALGAGLPLRDLVVSQQHRILVSSKICTRMFGQPEVLVAAKRLIDLPGIDVDQTCDSIEYIHILFENHEIVFSEGAATESLFTGQEAMKALPDEAKNEIFMLFPDLKVGVASPIPAAFIPENKLQRKLIERHFKNNKPLVEDTDQTAISAADESNVIRLVS